MALVRDLSRSLSGRRRTISKPEGFINPWQTDPRSAELHHERPVAYTGEDAGMCSFFYSLPQIICKCRGSIIPNVLIEVAIAGCCGVVAVLLHKAYDYDNIGMIGHQISGVALAFLTVFRTQSSWSQYYEGRGHLGAVISSTRYLAIDIIGTLSFSAIEEGMFEDDTNDVQVSDIDFMMLDFVRLLKLFYYVVVEHVRSTDGHFAWTAANAMVLRLATASERAEFQIEFGDEVQWKRKDMVPGHPDAQTRSGRLHDPTRAKPLLVLLWLRICLERMLCHKAIVATQLMTVADRLQTLVVAYGGIDKVDKTVLPFPYAQLLKLLMMLFVFSLPFVGASPTLRRALRTHARTQASRPAKGSRRLSPTDPPRLPRLAVVAELGVLTPLVSMVCALAFYGLDSVGSELEGPFGVDENDMPLLAMGGTHQLRSPNPTPRTTSHTGRPRRDVCCSPNLLTRLPPHPRNGQRGYATTSTRSCDRRTRRASRLASASTTASDARPPPRCTQSSPGRSARTASATRRQRRRCRPSGRCPRRSSFPAPPLATCRLVPIRRLCWMRSWGSSRSTLDRAHVGRMPQARHGDRWCVVVGTSAYRLVLQ